MSYAILINRNFKMKHLACLYRHNERKNTNYSNKDINHLKSVENYSIKAPYSTYEKVFRDLRKNLNLKGQVKVTSNIVCAMIITSDRAFFESIGPEETKRYFQTVYNFVANYNNLGEQYILSAKVHMDETTPHMHIVFVPVVHKKDPKSGKVIDKIACSEFWKGKNSYHKLQDSFYKYVIDNGFNLERGNSEDNIHVDPEEYKKLINYEEQLEMYESKKIKNVDESNLSMVVAQNKSLKLYINKLNTKLFKANTIIKKSKNVEKENKELYTENQKLKSHISSLNDYIEKTFEVVSILFDYPKNIIKNIVNNFVKSTNDKKLIEDSKQKGIDNNER